MTNSKKEERTIKEKRLNANSSNFKRVNSQSTPIVSKIETLKKEKVVRCENCGNIHCLSSSIQCGFCFNTTCSKCQVLCIYCAKVFCLSDCIQLHNDIFHNFQPNTSNIDLILILEDYALRSGVKLEYQITSQSGDLIRVKFTFGKPYMERERGKNFYQEFRELIISQIESKYCLVSDPSNLCYYDNNGNFIAILYFNISQKIQYSIRE